jgi:hypothetical protein
MREKKESRSKIKNEKVMKFFLKKDEEKFKKWLG